MRIALIADIHGNLPALDAVLGELEQEAVDEIVCLGDVAAMGPFPVETLESIRDLGCVVIMGNGDAAMRDPPDLREDNETARKFAEMDRWCAAQLSSSHLEFIRQFKATARIDLPGDERSLLCFHGSPRSYHDVISATTPDEEIDQMLEGERATIVAGGHWHFQMLRRVRHMTLFNPGSVGLSYDFDSEGQVFIPSRAEYGIITAGPQNLRLEHRRIAYDARITTQSMHDRGFPHAEWSDANWR